MLKKLTYILIFTILLIQGGILVFFMGTQQMVLKTYIGLKQIRSQEKQLETFYFSYTTFKQLKIDTKEFVMNGEMYDIKKIESHNGKIKVTAYKDGFEKKMLSIIGALTENNTGQSSFPTLINFFLSLVFIIQQVNMLSCHIKIDYSVNNFFYTNHSFKDVFIEVIKPPCLK